MQLAEARRQRGLTLAQVAKQTGVSAAQVSRWETGQDYPKPARLPKVAVAYQMEVGAVISAITALQDERRNGNG